MRHLDAMAPWQYAATGFLGHMTGGRRIGVEDHCVDPALPVIAALFMAPPIDGP
jgi:hypothetical protein